MLAKAASSGSTIAKLILLRDNDLENRWAEHRVDAHALPVAIW